VIARTGWCKWMRFLTLPEEAMCIGCAWVCLTSVLLDTEAACGTCWHSRVQAYDLCAQTVVVAGTSGSTGSCRHLPYDLLVGADGASSQVVLPDNSTFHPCTPMQSLVVPSLSTGVVGWRH
jgi:hypothetical protein